MEKWFEDKFEKNKLRSYTKSRLQPNYFSQISHKFSITNWLILINISVFIIISILISFIDQEKVILNSALQANAFFSGTVWTLFTSMFMHGGFGHLLFNMISLFFLGNFVERILGRKKFLRFYIISGLFAGLFYVILSFYLGTSDLGARIFVSPDVFAVGASGAIFALLGLLAILTPNSKVYLIAGPLIAIILRSLLGTIFPTASFLSAIDLFITFYFVIAIFSIFSFNPRMRKIAFPIEMSFWFLPIVAIVPLVIIGLFFPLPIGNTAHLGGLIAGLIYAIYLKNKYPHKIQHLSKVFRSR